MTARRSAIWIATAAALGVIVAGFWNVGVMDGLGLKLFIAPTIGGFEGKAEQFASLGGGFGFVFALVTGLATTVTASNCAALAMLPALAFASRGRRDESLRIAAASLLGAMLVAAIYGLFVGRLGAAGAAAFNAGPIRGAQSLSVFSAIGATMIVWAMAEGGLLASAVRLSPETGAFFSLSTTKAALGGILVGAFTIGRPLAVFREFLLYAAQPGRASYGAAVMAVEAVGAMLALMIGVVLLAQVAGHRLEHWTSRAPELAARTSAAALAAGGTFLIFYWGVSRIWPIFGRWGFKLGWYA